MWERLTNRQWLADAFETAVLFIGGWCIIGGVAMAILEVGRAMQ